MDLAEVRNVLIRGPNWLGDLVMATAGLRALRVACPRARITLWVRAGLEPLLAGSPDVDQIRGLPVYASRMSFLRNLGRAAESVRSEAPYDLGICLPDSLSSALLMRRANARPLVGYTNASRRFFLDHPVPVAEVGPEGRKAPREDRVLALMTRLGVAPRGTHPSLWTTPGEEEELLRVLSRLGKDGSSQPWVGLAPGAAYGSSKRWPVDRFAALGDALARDGAEIFILGAPHEASICTEVAQSMHAPASNLCGQLSLGAFKALIRRCGLVVSNDSGARHVAVAFDVPTLAFFGPTDVSRTRNNLEGVTILEGEADCRPCYQRECPTDHRCLLGITVDEVTVRARARLKSGQTSRVGPEIRL